MLRGWKGKEGIDADRKLIGRVFASTAKLVPQRKSNRLGIGERGAALYTGNVQRPRSSVISRDREEFHVSRLICPYRARQLGERPLDGAEKSEARGEIGDRNGSKKKSTIENLHFSSPMGIGREITSATCSSF